VEPVEGDEGHAKDGGELAACGALSGSGSLLLSGVSKDQKLALPAPGRGREANRGVIP
jgi:hypothetical protein